MINKEYEIHLAPMQGLTDASFRRNHAKYYGGVDFYYTPFIRIEHGLFRKRDLRELSEGKMDNCIPQVLPGSGEELKRLCEPIISNGYKCIDINLGCCFPPVMSHGRGAALLNNPDKLADILSALPSISSSVSFSIKTRLGYSDADQWKESIAIINDAPIVQVTLHARIAKQQYKGNCDWEAFDRFHHACIHPLIYNGDIKTMADAEAIITKWPNLRGIMIGRGLIADPQLAQRIRGAEIRNSIDVFRTFHNNLYNDASSRMSDSRQVANHLKPYWDYMFQDADRKSIKKIRKATTANQYLEAVLQFINETD